MRNRSNLYYIDKTKHLEEGISRFPSIYIEGNAACGKTTAVEMLLRKYPEIKAYTFDLKYELKNSDAFLEKIWRLKGNIKNETLWVVIENISGKIEERLAVELSALVYEICNDSCVIFISREKPQKEFLDLLWKQKMTLLTMEKLLFTEEEIRTLVKHEGVEFKVETLYEKTGGWPGCVRLLLSMAKDSISAKTVDELLDGYEMRAYVQEEMLSVLAEEEKTLLEKIAGCPWVSEQLASEVWGETNAQEKLENLHRKGFLILETEKQRWRIAALFLRYILPQLPKPGIEEVWYENSGYIVEALWCLKKSGTGEEYHKCILKYYDRAYQIGVLDEEILKWTEKTPEDCCLRGAYCYGVQNFEGLRREIEILKKMKEKDHKVKEILLNLYYLDPQTTLADWLNMLEAMREPGEKFRLYHMLGNSVTYLCGLRDISGLFACSKKEEKQTARLWKESFEETGWKCYQLARIDYYLETEQKDSITEEDWNLLREKADVQEIWQIRMAKFYLLCKLQRMHPEDSRVGRIYELENSLMRENHSVCVGITESISALYAPWYGAREKMSKWLRHAAMDNTMAITEENYVMFYCRAKGYLLLNQFERAEKILKKLVPYLQEYHRYRFMAEAFFQYALVNWEKDLKGQAVKNAIESFLISGSRRYVAFYVGYGRRGKEVLAAYVDWQKSNAPEVWNRKKKYNYGNVLRMPLEDYLEYILRIAKKASKANRKVSEKYIEERLTMMETIILQDIGRGMSNAQICEELNLKLPTVKGHVYSLFKKLGVNSRMQAVVKGKELGLLE